MFFWTATINQWQKLLPFDNYKGYYSSLEYLAMKKPIARSGNHEYPDVFVFKKKNENNFSWQMTSELYRRTRQYFCIFH